MSPVDELYWGATTFVDTIECHVGGNGSNTSLALAKLGVPTRLLGAVGNDRQGQFLLDSLRQAGVDIEAIERVGSPTSASIAVVKASGERKFFHCMGASRDAFADGVQFTPELCRGMVHYHLASLFVLPRLRAKGPQVLMDARSAGLSTSFDTNWDPDGGWMQTLAPYLPYTGTLFMNEAEATMIAGSSEPAQVAKVVLPKGLGILALKLGGQGCAIYTQDREIVCPAFDVKSIDTTGAGDCFVAGFLAATLDGASLAEAGRFANAVAALSVQKIGAVSGVVSKADTERWIAQAIMRDP